MPQKMYRMGKKIGLEMWVEELNTCQEKLFQAYKVVVVPLFMRRSTIFFPCWNDKMDVSFKKSFALEDKHLQLLT